MEALHYELATVSDWIFAFAISSADLIPAEMTGTFEMIGISLQLPVHGEFVSGKPNPRAVKALQRSA